MSDTIAPVYEFDAHIRYTETDLDGFMTLPSLLNIFQDCSIFQSEALGFGPQLLRHEQKAWVLSHWHIVVDRYPCLAEKVTIGTFANQFKTVTAKRNFYMLDVCGNMIARANSLWGFMDMTSGKPCRPSPEHLAAYGVKEALEMPPETRKIVLPETFETCDPMPVHPDQIDTNNHVNNAQYVKMALAALPHITRPHTLRVDFRRAAVMGDSICPYIAREEERTVVKLCDSQADIFGVVELQ